MSHYKPYPAYKDSGVEWLGRVPEHWEQVPLKRLVRSIEQGWSPECESWPATGDEWGVLKVGCVNGGSFRPEENKALPASLEPRPELAVCKGDVLVSRANTRELVGSCVSAPQNYPNLLLCDKIYRIRAGERVTPEFLAALISVHGRRAVEIEATGASSSMLNISQSVILDLPVALPEPAEQDQIMAAATRETARIDALVAKKTRFIELLREKRQALITHAVTKGLDPNVKMKDSGVEWLGEVPEHWAVKPFKVCIDFQEGPGIMAADFCDEGIPLLRVAGVQNRWASLEGCNYLSPDKVERQWRHFRLEQGDLLISASASMGTVCEVAAETVGAVAYTGLIRLREKNSVMLKEYIRSLVVSDLFSTQIDFFKAGSTIQHFGPTHLSQMFVVCPPLDEQGAIARHIESETQRIDELVTKTERSSELLKERRSALITAAVTGQIDLREEV
ncbi:restriction endonuclease subunit S [Pseudomonas sp. GCM10022188]|uniref:restriction endonuclease subunit S n=1 Tax=Pseudomonas TaxID=286 RepID=UPI001E293D9F|nr:restriction endonuclease subunit S [Pseudomonas oryzagri]MCC6077422.1 restriction endonuclease subunit S [Pseudomonas oryzagri]